MSSKYALDTFGGLEEFNLFDDVGSCKKIAVFQIDSHTFGLLSYYVEGCRISFFKLSFDGLIETPGDVKQHFKLNNCLLKVFCLPFTLLTVISTTQNIWVIGQETIVDLKPYIEETITISKSDEDDDRMDIDDIEEFHSDMFDQQLSFRHLQKYPFQTGDIFLECNLTYCHIVSCRKNSRLNRWDLELVLVKRLEASDALTVPIINLPFKKTPGDSSCREGQDESWRPLILFISPHEPEYEMFQTLFGINCVSSSVICLVGQPDGKLMWTFCDANNFFRPSSDLQILYDMKQSIIDIYFIKEIQSLKDCACLLVIGALGQLTLICSKKHPSFNLEPGFHPKWTKTFHLKSFIGSCVLLNDCLFHLSKDGTLSVTDLSELFMSDRRTEELCNSSTSPELGRVDQLILADEKQGVVLLKMKCGNIYVTRLRRDESSASTSSSSLPSLMNECLKQSNEMQHLLNKKVLQSRLFSTLSTFASLKFRPNTLKEPVRFSISEVNLEPKKYLLNINLKCMEKLLLDPELCYSTATVFTYFENSNSLITKTVPYDVDQLTLCLDLTDTILQPPYVSIFPLFVEVGLILQLPEQWKKMDCFETVSTCLPFYLRVQSFMVHELHLLQSQGICPPQSLKCDIPKTVRMVKELGLKRPISNVMQVHSRKDFNLPRKFRLFLSASSVGEIMKGEDSDPCKYVEKLLMGEMRKDGEETHVTSKTGPMSLKVTKNNSHFMITLSANTFQSVVGLRIAVMDILLSQNQHKQLDNSSTYVNIPASIYRKCEEVSKTIVELCGKDVESDEFVSSVMQLYQELRTDISGKLPVF